LKPGYRFQPIIRDAALWDFDAKRHGVIIASYVSGAPIPPAYMIRALCASLLLFAMSWPASTDNAKPLTTILLVAQAELRDPNFKDSIVLVMNNIGPAPAGVIINRPTSIAVSRLFPDLERLAQLDDKVYFGGPVEIANVSFLVRADAAPEHATEVLYGVYISTNQELLRKLLGRDKPMDGLRIFIGYSGWAPGQLEAEIARGDWTLAPAEPNAIFDGKSERPWPDRQTPDAGHRS
jgi:putative transcriptional regulator